MLLSIRRVAAFRNSNPEFFEERTDFHALGGAGRITIGTLCVLPRCSIENERYVRVESEWLVVEFVVDHLILLTLRQLVH